MRNKHIDSPQNATIKSVAKLRTRRGREQQGRIVVDGRREVERAINQGVTLESIFVPEHEDVVPESACDTFVVSPRAFEKIALGPRHDIVAVAKTPSRPLDHLQLNSTTTIAILESIEKPGNNGAVLRSADGAGIDAVILIDPVTDLFNPNAIRSSLGTIFSVPTAVASFAEYREWSTSRDLSHYLARCDQNAKPYWQADFATSCAIVLGSEASGLTDRWDQLPKTESIHIPMRGIADSLNIASSAAILFYKATEGRC